MADLYLQNESIKIGINKHGAELVSLIRLEDEREYMWCGDSKFWGRVSPVLFPFVGKLNNQKYIYNGTEYSNIPQHGFARDCEFYVVNQTNDTLWLELEKSDLMKEKYPFNYTLQIGYRIEGNSLHVMWMVRNDGNEALHFSIGAHPAFSCEGLFESKKYWFDFYNGASELLSGELNLDGVLSKVEKSIALDDGKLELTSSLFAQDALITSGKGINTVSINDENGVVLKLRFDAPMLGLWSPAGKNAPFVCIEPWFGRCDRDDFSGDLSQREYGNSLENGHSFNKEYVIDIPTVNQ